jgi:hypothetical protein
MGKTIKPNLVKLIVGLIVQDPLLFEKAKSLLQKKFGKIDFTSSLFSFDQTDYYEKEMGKDLKRLFLGFERLIPAEKLVNIKLFTNALERKFSKNHLRRSINIDPGYITLSKLVLATTKSFVHRLYIRDGIYEEITLYFKNNTFVAGPWTYPDYRLPSHIALFNRIREKYYRQIEEKYGPAQLYRCV